ncbi:DUF1890 domain-containing protein [Methanosphaerula palustris]|uniref:DUF1890 domain-containing protein n=1 Tax=Methanosphaerula palustris (strain ATCC BAA-1556 / DSM 19958 / E1-9c) TaxID=521011 RepID=B8GH97_METPE|nr:DUF1890 domain-containing protein [Methanosphaerula palustris]ACL16502.1 conserved hypothetical protein [Methanosphaerula palustris E1-9c]
MTGPPVTSEKGLIILGCPEASAQQALALHVAHNLKKRGAEVLIAGNPAVLNLLKVSDPEKHYITNTMTLEQCIGDVIENKRDCDLCVVFAHNDAAITYAATMRYLLPERKMVVIVFGKDPGPLADAIQFPCEIIVDRAVHNPMKLKTMINRVFGWDENHPT